MKSIIIFGIVGLVITILFLVLTQVVANAFKSKSKKRYREVTVFTKNSILYLLVSSILLSLPVLLCFLLRLDKLNLTSLYIILAIYVFVLGIIHFYTHYKYVKWADKEVDVLPDIFYTIAIVLFAALIFNLLMALITRDVQVYSSFMIAFFTFMIPMFIHKSIFLYKQIPDFEYDTFKIPEGYRHVTAFENEESREIKVTFKIKLDPHDKNWKSFDGVLLSIVPFGVNVFHELIRLIKQGNKIKTVDENGKDMGFIFYLKPKKILSRKRFIDPKKTVLVNNISEKDEIIFRSIKEKEM